MKRKANLTIDSELHDRALVHAKRVHFTDFSGYVTKLIVADINRLSPLTGEQNLVPEKKSRQTGKSRINHAC